LKVFLSLAIEDEIDSRTAKRKSALVLDIFQGETTMAEACPAYHLPHREREVD
jgi:hypothetical protein